MINPTYSNTTEVYTSYILVILLCTTLFISTVLLYILKPYIYNFYFSGSNSTDKMNIYGWVSIGFVTCKYIGFK